MTDCQSDPTLHSDRMSQKSGCAVSISCSSVLIDNPQMVSLRHCSTAKRHCCAEPVTRLCPSDISMLQAGTADDLDAYVPGMQWYAILLIPPV